MAKQQSVSSWSALEITESSFQLTKLCVRSSSKPLSGIVSELKVFYGSDSDPDVLDADEVIITSGDYIVKSMGDVVSIIPKNKVNRIDPGSLVEVSRDKD